MGNYYRLREHKSLKLTNINNAIAINRSVQVDHNNTKHAIILRHIAHSDTLYESFGELKLNTSTYSLNNLIDLKEHEIRLDVHLDQCEPYI